MDPTAALLASPSYLKCHPFAYYYILGCFDTTLTLYKVNVRGLFFLIETKRDAEIIAIQYLEAIMHNTKRSKISVSEQYELKYITISTVSS